MTYFIVMENDFEYREPVKVFTSEKEAEEWINQWPEFDENLVDEENKVFFSDMLDIAEVD